MHTEQDRSAYNADIAKEAETDRTNKWLALNPRIGVLNGGKYYIIESRETVYINKFQSV